MKILNLEFGKFLDEVIAVVLETAMKFSECDNQQIEEEYPSCQGCYTEDMFERVFVTECKKRNISHQIGTLLYFAYTHLQVDVEVLVNDLKGIPSMVPDNYEEMLDNIKQELVDKEEFI